MPIVLLLAVWVAILWWIMHLVLPICGLIIAWMFGAANPGDRNRLLIAWVVACLLNLLASIVPFQPFRPPYTIPIVACGIASCVGGIAGQKSWLFGTLSSYWFLLPWLVYKSHFVPPSQIATSRDFSVTSLYVTLGAGLAGGVMPSIVLRLRASSLGKRWSTGQSDK